MSNANSGVRFWQVYVLSDRLSYSVLENVLCTLTVELKETWLHVVDEAGEGSKEKHLVNLFVFLEETLEVGESGRIMS
jgi:hypothetical protein